MKRWFEISPKKTGYNGKVCLNLGCGNDIKEGFINVDIFGTPDVKHDLNKHPYPFRKDSVDYIFANHVIEHLDNPIAFMKEIHRILKKGGTAEIHTPPYYHKLSWINPDHKWHFHEDSIDYFANFGANGADERMNGLFDVVKKEVWRGKFIFWHKWNIQWIVRKK